MVNKIFIPRIFTERALPVGMIPKQGSGPSPQLCMRNNSGKAIRLEVLPGLGGDRDKPSCKEGANDTRQ